MVHEGIYKCTLEDSGKVLAEASVPVTVVRKYRVTMLRL